MIQPLRRAHLRIFIVLAVLVPLIFFLALIKRRPLPPVAPAQANPAAEVSP
jgi:hypothetical protein